MTLVGFLGFGGSGLLSFGKESHNSTSLTATTVCAAFQLNEKIKAPNKKTCTNSASQPAFQAIADS